MHRDRIAELLLSSVTTPDRVQSILGDLRESAATRGELWFWVNVLGTTAALSWRGVADDRRGMFVLALRAWLLSLGLSLLVFLVGTFSKGLLLGAGLPDWGGPGKVLALFTTLVAVCQFLIGRWIGRRSPGRELSACLAFTMLQCALEYPTVLLSPWVQGAAFGLLLNFLTHAFCFLGALSVHREVRRVRT